MSFDAAALLKDFNADKLNALIEAMLLAADADGEFSSDERKELSDSIRGLAPHGSPIRRQTAVGDLAGGARLTDWRLKTWPPKSTRPPAKIVELEG